MPLPIPNPADADKRTLMRCACPSSDPRGCIQIRYGRGVDDDERCTCSCHDECSECGDLDCNGQCMEYPGGANG